MSNLANFSNEIRRYAFTLIYYFSLISRGRLIKKKNNDYKV